MTPSTQANAASATTAVVIGGGLAGISAAVRLAQTGLSVTIVETRRRLGGRATSFVDPATRAVLDNCQHVLLGCCTNLVDLYARLGVARAIKWHRTLYLAMPAPDGEGYVIDRMTGDDLPAPLHLFWSLVEMRGLSALEKLAIARGMLAALRAGGTDRAALHGISFAQWLEAQCQPPGVVEKFWAPLAIGAVNETPGRMAADHALQVFREGMLANRGSYVMGLAAVPLVQLYDSARRLLCAAGGRLMLGASARALHYDARSRRITGLGIEDNQTLKADVYVSALPPDRLARLCPPALVAADDRLARLDAFTFSPIIGIHLFIACPDGRPALRLPHVMLTHSPLHWLFNKGFECPPGEGRPPDGAGPVQHLHGVISAAHELVDWPGPAIVDMALRELARLAPEAARRRLVHARVVKERRATFSAAPGTAALRPAAGPSAPAAANLYLAGDWCRTGWPATMEGAVRSGNLAAQAVLADLGRTQRLLIDDLPADPLYRLLAG